MGKLLQLAIAQQNLGLSITLNAIAHSYRGEMYKAEKKKASMDTEFKYRVKGRNLNFVSRIV